MILRFAFKPHNEKDSTGVEMRWGEWKRFSPRHHHQSVRCAGGVDAGRRKNKKKPLRQLNFVLFSFNYFRINIFRVGICNWHRNKFYVGVDAWGVRSWGGKKKRVSLRLDWFLTAHSWHFKFPSGRQTATWLENLPVSAGIFQALSLL